MILVSDTPETHRSISHAEREYILSSLKDQVQHFGGDLLLKSEHKPQTWSFMYGLLRVCYALLYVYVNMFRFRIIFLT